MPRIQCEQLPETSDHIYGTARQGQISQDDLFELAAWKAEHRCSRQRLVQGLRGPQALRSRALSEYLSHGRSGGEGEEAMCLGVTTSIRPYRTG